MIQYRKIKRKNSNMKTKHFLSALAVAAAFTACVSSESNTLKITRETQVQVVKDAAALDSSLLADIASMSAMRDTMGNDTTLTTDSLAMIKFVAFKSKIGELEGLSAEVRVWRENLTLLTSKEDMAKGAKNPFGRDNNDEAVKQKITEYQSQLNELTERAKTLRSKE
jgi:hypothetical protein